MAEAHPERVAAMEGRLIEILSDGRYGDRVEPPADRGAYLDRLLKAPEPKKLRK